jgi:rhodanese-related sulfurtransferase
MMGMGTDRTTVARLTAATFMVWAVFATGCSDETVDATPEAATTAAATPSQGVRLVTPEDGAAIQADAPADLVVLDVRTAEEFADGHLEGAVVVDFYAPDFADQLAGLDPDVPYLLYCRSGNRSGQAAGLMADLGFVDVANVDGGILAWADAGLEIVTE